MQLVRLSYQPPASSTFLSQQTSHQQPASSAFLSEQTSTSHQPSAKRTGRWFYSYYTTPSVSQFFEALDGFKLKTCQL
jgi:hypothetical protein